MVISHSQEDASQVHGKLKFGRDIIPLQNSINILGVEVDSQLHTLYKAQVRSVRPKRSFQTTGSDGVSPHLINCAEELTRLLVMIFHQYLLVRAWLSQWKEARVTPMHKKARSEPSNYQLISLLLVANKIFERITGEQLTSFIEEYRHLQSQRQFGFRKGRSTSDLLLLAKSWHDALDAGCPSL